MFEINVVGPNDISVLFYVVTALFLVRRTGFKEVGKV